ncbi:MAG TPA: anhydro-N-acetylmuramic acid kinase [Pseudomonadales bacterium]|nr:anhydro-N-acetylmuramic acid kinase [Pseudomonadales bacterium]
MPPSPEASAGELFVGVMSGTSLDGIDVALVDLATAIPVVLHARTVPIDPDLRADMTRLCMPGNDHVDLLGASDTAFGDAIGTAVLEVLAEASVDPSRILAIGSHGQTIRHRPEGARPFTLQIGDPNRIAERTGITVVADFRRRDMAAGGQGAPLVPAFHRAVFGSSRDRVVVNIGGMANITLLHADRPTEAGGFDTGPGNVLLDGWARRHLLTPMDEGGAWAAQARVDTELLDDLLTDPYFSAPAPKSTGREHFDMPWLDARLERARAPAAVQATLTELTARTIADGIRVTASMAPADVLVCGGGRHNDLLMARLAAALPGARVLRTDEMGMDGDWVEAVAFAWLAQRRLAGLAGNVPAVTGAAGERVLGAIYPGADGLRAARSP